jgi:hypothetical protein
MRILTVTAREAQKSMRQTHYFLTILGEVASIHEWPRKMIFPENPYARPCILILLQQVMYSSWRFLHAGSNYNILYLCIKLRDLG